MVRPYSSRPRRATSAATPATVQMSRAGGAPALVALRGLLEYGRTMVAHHTAARVQAQLRTRLYGQITALGPAHFTQARTGDVVLSIVEGVQQLEVYFG